MVEPGEWVLKIGNGFTVLADDEFQAIFVAD